MVTQRSGDVISHVKETIAHGAHAIDVDDVRQLLDLIARQQFGLAADELAEIPNPKPASGEYNNG